MGRASGGRLMVVGVGGGDGWLAMAGDGFRVVWVFDCKGEVEHKERRVFIVSQWELDSCLGVRVWAA